MKKHRMTLFRGLSVLAFAFAAVSCTGRDNNQSTAAETGAGTGTIDKRII